MTDEHREANGFLVEENQVMLAKRTYAKVAALIALPVALVALIPSLVGIELLRREVQHRCMDAAVNREAIRATVIDGLPTLGYRYDPETQLIFTAGKPTVEYYATHPAERQDALERTKTVLARFPTIAC